MIGVQAFGRPVEDPRRLDRAHPRLDRGQNASSDTVLKLEQVAGRALIALGPYRDVADDIDQLGVDPQARALPLHAAVKHVAHVEFTGDLTQVLVAVAVSQRRISGNDVKRPISRQTRNDLVGYPFTVIAFIVRASDGPEWQHRD